MITADNITDEQLRAFLAAHIAGPFFKTVQIALGRCCIPCTAREVAGVFAQRCPTMTEAYLARADVARQLNAKSAP